MKTYFSSDQIAQIHAANSAFCEKIASGAQGHIHNEDNFEKVGLMRELLASDTMRNDFMEGACDLLDQHE